MNSFRHRHNSESKDKEKLAGVVEAATEGFEAMFANHRRRSLALETIRFASVQDLKRSRDSVFRPLAGIAAQTSGEQVRLLQHEIAIEEIERLQGRVGAAALGDDLIAARAIEGAEDRVLLLPDARQVNHAPKFVRGEIFLREIAIHIVHLHLLQVEARASH